MAGNERGSRLNGAKQYASGKDWPPVWSTESLSQIHRTSAHKSRDRFLSFFFFYSFRLCLNAQYCHEKMLVGTFASFLLMSSCGWQKHKTRELLSLSPLSLFWFKMITKPHFETRASWRGETNGFISQTSFKITQSFISPNFAQFYSHNRLEMGSHFSQGWFLTG